MIVRCTVEGGAEAREDTNAAVEVEREVNNVDLVSFCSCFDSYRSV